MLVEEGLIVFAVVEGPVAEVVWLEAGGAEVVLFADVWVLVRAVVVKVDVVREALDIVVELSETREVLVVVVVVTAVVAAVEFWGVDRVVD